MLPKPLLKQLPVARSSRACVRSKFWSAVLALAGKLPSVLCRWLAWKSP